jgi:DNA invertase Pin-like site-specific DNA recombinase
VLPRLPRDAAELRGRRAARWVRESTPGQLDRWGPPSQRRMQDLAIAELGLADTGLAWTVGRSGWSGPDSMDEPPATQTPEFRAMLAAAEAGAFEVLLVGYTARYMRDLALALTYRRWFHRQGVVVYICDDRILSSNAADWERLVDKAKAAEINSGEQSRNVRAGYAAKLETHRDPGGHPPFGFRRAGTTKVVEVDPERIGTAVRAYELAVAGLTDREVAGRLGLGLHTVRGILTSPLYRGRLRDGTPANWPPVVDEATWHRVADLRAARNRRSPGRPETRRTYALPMLACAACGRRLVGDKDRYRHLEACEAFMAARPAGGDVRGRHTRIPGQSYGRDEYEAIVPFILEQVRLGARDVAAASETYARGTGAEPDQLRLARIEEERERALAAYRRQRDTAALEQTMRELDDAEQAARGEGQARPQLAPDEVRRYLEYLPDWWRDAEPEDRRALAVTLFERIGVLGVNRVWVEPTQEALHHGLAEAFGPDEVEMVGARGLEPPIPTSASARSGWPHLAFRRARLSLLLTPCHGARAQETPMSGHRSRRLEGRASKAGKRWQARRLTYDVRRRLTKTPAAAIDASPTKPNPTAS